MGSSAKLAAALDAAGLPEMAAKARHHHWHDFLSPLDFPQMALSAELVQIGTKKALHVRDRLHNGDFDATDEEAAEWERSPEGQAAIARLVRP
jgi:hypothetical protein